MSNILGMQLQLDAVEDMCKEANVEDLVEVFEDFNDVAELLQTGSVTVEIGKEKIVVSLSFERAPRDG